MSFRQVGGNFDKSKYRNRPRYTVVLHQLPEMYELSLNTYVVVDSIHKLSTSDPKFPYCVMSKDNLATFLVIERRTVFRAIFEADKRDLIERGKYGLRAIEKWIKAVEVYSIK